jgi:ribonuclease HI
MKSKVSTPAQNSTQSALNTERKLIETADKNNNHLITAKGKVMKVDLNKTNGTSPPVDSQSEDASYSNRMIRKFHPPDEPITSTSDQIRIRAWFDGACEPTNPNGHATWGAVVEVDGHIVLEESGYVGFGHGMTNNVAEYCGCVAVLREITKHEGNAMVFGDSKLVIEQMRGSYRVKSGPYIPYFAQAKAILESIGTHRVEFQWIPRSENTKADGLSHLPLLKRGIRTPNRT